MSWATRRTLSRRPHRLPEDSQKPGDVGSQRSEDPALRLPLRWGSYTLPAIFLARKGGEIHMLVFLVGALLGLLTGGALCVRYLRREIAADIGPKLKQMQLQLDNIQAELTLANATRHAELTASSRHQHER